MHIAEICQRRVSKLLMMQQYIAHRRAQLYFGPHGEPAFHQLDLADALWRYPGFARQLLPCNMMLYTEYPVSQHESVF